MKKSFNHWIGLTTILASLMVFSLSASVAAKEKLIGDLSKKVNKLDADKDFGNKKLLVMVGQNKKTTTVSKYLSTVETVLSDTQFQLFTLPLVMASLQQMPVAKVKVGGTVVADLAIGNTLPAGLEGVADMYLIFEGDASLPAQVLANLGSAE